MGAWGLGLGNKQCCFTGKHKMVAWRCMWWGTTEGVANDGTPLQ